MTEKCICHSTHSYEKHITSILSNALINLTTHCTDPSRSQLDKSLCRINNEIAVRSKTITRNARIRGARILLIKLGVMSLKSWIEICVATRRTRTECVATSTGGGGSVTSRAFHWRAAGETVSPRGSVTA